MPNNSRSNIQRTEPPSWSSNSKAPSRKIETVEIAKWRPVRLAFQGGYSHLLAKGSEGLSADLQAYEDALRSGWHLAATLDYFTNNNQSGIGIKFHTMQTQNSGQFSALLPDLNGNPTPVDILIEDRISIVYVGPHLVYRAEMGDMGSNFVIGSSFGYVNYVNNGHFINPLLVEGSGFGVMVDINFDIALAEGIKFNIGSSALLNSMRQLDVNGTRVSLTQEESLNNTHFNLSAGFVFDIE